jgi:hypothetical protein
VRKDSHRIYAQSKVMPGSNVFETWSDRTSVESDGMPSAIREGEALCMSHGSWTIEGHPHG